MSTAFPSMYYCKKHQGNRVHYAKKDCAVCRLVKALSIVVDHLPSPDTLNAVDDDDLTGTRPIPVRLTIAEARKLHAALAEAGR